MMVFGYLLALCVITAIGLAIGEIIERRLER
jgi:hypothetical protein